MRHLQEEREESIRISGRENYLRKAKWEREEKKVGKRICERMGYKDEALQVRRRCEGAPAEAPREQSPPEGVDVGHRRRIVLSPYQWEA